MLAQKTSEKKKKQRQHSLAELPPIPNRLYFTIGDASELCGLEAHVLRYWEEVFPFLNPVKRRGARRYYQKEDIILIRQICDLLYNQGFTIEGARAQLMMEKSDTTQPVFEAKQFLQKSLAELSNVLHILETAV